MTRYAHIRAVVFDQPWNIIETKLDQIVSILDARVAGEHLTDEQIGRRVAAATSRAARIAPGGTAVGVLPILGVLVQRGDMLTDMSGATSYGSLRRGLRQLMDDPDVGGILLDIDSPGGEAQGCEELAAEIRAARDRKPIAASIDTTAGSAAYYLGAQATEIIASPSSMMGSIGTVLKHDSIAGALEQEGVERTYIVSKVSPRKMLGNSAEPLSDEARAEFQRIVDFYGDQFVAAVAKGRGVPASKVRSDFGQGDMFMAADAVKAGLADRVGSFDEAIARLSTGKVGRSVGAAGVPYRIEAGANLPAFGMGAAIGTTDEVETPEPAPAPAEEPAPDTDPTLDPSEDEPADDGAAASREAETRRRRARRFGG